MLYFTVYYISFSHIQGQRMLGCPEAEINHEISELVREKLESISKENSQTKQKVPSAPEGVPSIQGSKIGTTDVSSAKDGYHSLNEDDEQISLHIWDFAGHGLYYTTHQVICLRIFKHVYVQMLEEGGGGISFSVRHGENP